MTTPHSHLLDSASRKELLALVEWTIQNNVFRPDYRPRLERQLCNMRENHYLAQMTKACEEMRRSVGTPQWFLANKKWERARVKLNALTPPAPSGRAEKPYA